MKAAAESSGQALPVRSAAIQGSNGHQQHQRIHGKQVTRQQRAAQHAEKHRVHQQQYKNAAELGGCNRRPRLTLDSVFIDVCVRREQQRGGGHQHRHKKIHVRGQMEEAVREGGQKAQRREIGLRVVAQKFRIAEDEALFEVVVRVPARPAAACNW